MADILLIHGSCHGAWCWRDLIPALEGLGHTARAIDLPSHGADPTPIADVTLDLCRDAILAGSTPETIILGHSWGGYPVSAAAEANPDAMRGLIFLSAYVPKDGLSMAEMRSRAPRQPAAGSVEMSADGLSFSVLPDRVQDLFFHDCTPEVVAYALAHLCPQAVRPQDTPLPTGENFAQIPKAYIRSTDDRTIPPEYQTRMSHCAPPEMRHSIDSSHSAFFSHPRELARMIDGIMARM
ncbi:alpha/beta fold hydrolase [Ruegeria sp.]|uniref:alpha/beta fold hydrolase n=1 Tax=Ruegeria sp. TaxID=1879320 RepID=UPI00231DDCB9|nr:alpha/beta fold hydrolase [Ruegeria sp.]MDA7964650.1 alpha/beta fold hydrolase [Ruegeria sp.]